MNIKKTFINGIGIFILTTVLHSCNIVTDSPSNTEPSGKERKLPAGMIYAYNCLEKDSGSLSGILGKADNIIGKVATFNIEVSDQDQVAFGEQFLKEAVKDKNFVIDSVNISNEKLNTILNDLVRKRVKPTGISYRVYLLDDTATINAYTVGGKIFVTKAIINKCTNDDQLYAVIGHEMGHNEKGHIKNGMKAMKASKKFFGEWGDMFFLAKKLLTGSFNQKNELEADYYGLDLAWKLGYDICAVPAFWNGMARAEKHDDKAFDFLRTHPYSDTRSTCLVNHIKTNFKLECQ